MRPKPGASAASGIRGAYETLGVQGFYAAHGHEYVNPHDDQIVRAIDLLMGSQQFGEQPGQMRVLDLSCGSGEVTVALEAWAAASGGGQRPGPQQQAAAQPEQQAGTSGQQAAAEPGLPLQQQEATEAAARSQQDGADEQQQQPAQPPQQRIQDVAQQQTVQQARRQRQQCLASATGPSLQLDITACDPYTQQAYERRTGRSAHGWSFQDIADGCLAGRSFHLCVCSFALHLCDPSCLFITLYQLACHCRWLAILAPHKQPAIKEEHGWSAVQAWKVDRVHVRLYASLNFGQALE